MTSFSFDITHTDTKSTARTGVIHTPHGDIQTPAFVPVGTQGSVKALSPDELNTIDVQLYFVNTYHMYLRPGIDVIKKAGGLHNFMHWDKPLITDSGGFQVFSLARTKTSAEVASSNARVLRSFAKARAPSAQVSHLPKLTADEKTGSLVKITEDGVEFQSHWDGSKHFFTPESSMQWQWEMGADMHIAFDDCTAYPVTHEGARASMERTHRWAERSLAEQKKLSSRAKRGDLSNILKIASSQTPRNDNYQALYGSIQGSVFQDLREESAKFISAMDFDGIAIGGVSVGESKHEMKEVLSWVTPFLPKEKPRHLLGVGEIDDVFALVAAGMDTFDCVQPTRLARVGTLLVRNKPITQSDQFTNGKKYQIDITKAVFEEDFDPIERDCTCYTCQNFTRAYVHHLFHVKELLSYRLASIHNLHFMHRLMEEIRISIEENRFLELKEQWL